MQDELKEKWVKALRSGSYAQGHGALRNRDNTYCCLGVLLDVSDIGEWDDASDLGPLIYEITGDNDDNFPDTREELDLGPTSLDYFDLDPETQSTLVEMNDDEGATFEEIADWIEENV